MLLLYDFSIVDAYSHILYSLYLAKCPVSYYIVHSTTLFPHTHRVLPSRLFWHDESAHCVPRARNEEVTSFSRERKIVDVRTVDLAARYTRTAVDLSRGGDACQRISKSEKKMKLATSLFALVRHATRNRNWLNDTIFYVFPLHSLFFKHTRRRAITVSLSLWDQRPARSLYISLPPILTDHRTERRTPYTKRIISMLFRYTKQTRVWYWLTSTARIRTRKTRRTSCASSPSRTIRTTFALSYN